MDSSKQAMVEALLAKAPPPEANMLLPNPQLEQQAVPMNIPMHPLVQAIMNRLGLLNLIRNRSNMQAVDPTQTL